MREKFSPWGNLDWVGLLNDDLVGADHAQHVARLLIEKVEIKVVIAETLGQIFHPRNLGAQLCKVFFENGFFRFDLDTTKQAVIALNGGKGKDRGKRKRHSKKQERTYRGTVLLCCHVCLIRAVLRRLTQV